MTDISIPPKLRIALIVATDVDRAIGKENRIPWRHKADMRFFRETTTNHMVLMGRNTWKSLGEKPLPKRHNFVLSGSLDKQFFPEYPPLYPSKGSTSLQLVSDIQAAVDRADATRSLAEMHHGENPILFIIGGEAVYEAFLPYASAIFHNVIQTRVENPDKHFPEIGQKEWGTLRQIVHGADPTEGDLSWREQIFIRRIHFTDADVHNFLNVWTGGNKD